MHTFIEQEEIDIVFLSESWERQSKTLDAVMNLENHTVIANVNQRKGIGGRPAIFANNKKYQVQNLTNTVVQIPWGVEAVWCLITPKNVSNNSKIKKIACCALYSKPNSKKKSLLLDHISDAYNLLSTKYENGLHFIIAGDTNDLKLDNILSLDNSFVQVVKKWTRMNPPSILDPIIMTLSKYYQEPEYLQPLDADPGTGGVKSDHRIPLIRPIDNINNNSLRSVRNVKFRPFPQTGFHQMQQWLTDQTWNEVYKAESAHEKAENFQTLLVNALNKFFPEKIQKISNDDQPWINFKIKKLDRQRKRIFHKERRSNKYIKLENKFKTEVKKAKQFFYKKSVADLKKSNPRQWYSSLKKLSSHDQVKREIPIVDEIRDLSDQEQAEKIADKFAQIQNEYNPLQTEDISVPKFNQSEIPKFEVSKVWFALTKINTNKSTVPGDFPAILIKKFAAYLADPLTNIINSSISQGKYPQIYKYEISTPVPKVHPTESTDQLRNISGLLNFDKIMEKLIAELMISDMKANLDPSQYGNQKKISIDHYLINMIHRILSALDKKETRKCFAVVANLIDWNNAFPRQCPKLGVESFIKNGVRPSLIPVLVNYFQNREMTVKWHGCQSVSRKINGGGPQGATIGILEYLSQSNDSANIVDEKDRFKFVDDLTVLEILDLLSIGLTSYNIKQHIPSDISSHNQFIPPENLKSQEWLENINLWTKNQKMKLNLSKTKTMIFNNTKKFQFSTRLHLENENIEVINSTKLLGTIISNDLKWTANTKDIVKKANSRMQILRKVANFGAPIEDMKLIYFSFIRSKLEQSATVWHSSLYS